MSLRSFHLFFIGVSTLLCLFLMLWGLWSFKVSGSYEGLGLGILGIAGMIGLVQYLKWFRKKDFSSLKALVAVLLTGYLLGDAVPAQACSVCFGDPTSLLTKGAIMGVLVLLAIVVTILGLIIAVARSWIKRAKTLSIPL